ncbi:hypothetical protein H112_05830 [Trichophyton rubrum D6]|uniref:F-box domain-containing protein n=3 Tax=Trichophyton rubrum TaxID=5551 RepID=A0A178ERK9_TRIRU|nr:uncharacterized protein TERG_03538 [Trichophyton rubrum CBS 118892]EZF15988.1 hypothetical protein H100_05844 [Trichophyton rubrum MR850]EZF40117.1 hypothetical protein H102_05813 [Trichophyton rubrum CBS 100081]EZF50742.1 hypothetical protein H103_05841 [Trichophyton rubrum CBS 288.86]EZF61347.1 hypothetical protein H104_05827 [Trichophyton rubrum CBS 289.86]EZF82654.1 hypothetical protein H110_05835 [Trichophyton rubrum MR1448]EZF93357.1 hypothetical protein H113_05883 [Trichophyton rubr
MATIQDLPLEILQQICDFVASGYRASLYDFALVCQRWSLASNAVRFREVRIVVENQGKLTKDLDYWSGVLRSTSSLRSVRRLEIKGELPADVNTWAPKRIRQPKHSLIDSDDELESARYTLYTNLLELPEVTVELDKYWTPVAHFVAQLRALQDLVFDCVNQFPPCLLDVLHQILPSCKLHLHNFGLRNLYSYKGWSRGLDKHEYSLATSPSLHCIILHYEGNESERLVDYNDVAVARMSQGLAPNLRHVQVNARSMSPITYNRRVERRPKRDIFPNDTPNSDADVRGELHTMKFSGFLFGGLQGWNERIVFSSLRKLILDTVMDPFSLKKASTYNFTSLRTLYLRLESDNWDEHSLMDEAASGFLRSLPPLSTLKLTGNFGHDSLKAIIDRHNSLGRIWLSPRVHSHFMGTDFTLTLDTIRDLTSRCSELRTVCLTIPRVLKSQDMAIYQSIGCLPHLKDLCLYLDCICHEDSTPSPTIEDGLPNFAKIKNLVTNKALNDDIARNIFHEIYQAQSRHRMPVFKRLRIQVVRMKFTRDIPEDLDRIINVSGQGFELTLNPTQRQDCYDIIIQRSSPRNF